MSNNNRFRDDELLTRIPERDLAARLGPDNQTIIQGMKNDPYAKPNEHGYLPALVLNYMARTGLSSEQRNISAYPLCDALGIDLTEAIEKENNGKPIIRTEGQEENSDLVASISQIHFLVTNIPLAQGDSDESLVLRYQQTGDSTTLKKINDKYLHLATSIGVRYAKKHDLDPAPVIADAQSGLRDAIESYSPRRFKEFMRYALLQIHDSIQHGEALVQRQMITGSRALSDGETETRADIVDEDFGKAGDKEEAPVLQGPLDLINKAKRPKKDLN